MLSDMSVVEVKAQDVRLPSEAVAALTNGHPVAVTRYGRRTVVLIDGEQFTLIEPILELLKQGVTLSPELLMTEEDTALMRDLSRDREPAEAEAAQLEALISEELGA
jgi:hypothetical protein